MLFQSIIEELNKKNVSELRLITLEGKEIVISKQDTLEEHEKYLLIKSDGKEETIPFDEIDEINPITSKKHQIRSFKRPGQRNRH